ncbi:MAG: pyridoxal 5'-phosphate synthase glutaminase subunit PdxT [Trueperaceae bacterium]|nr:pyridoxal 5'-phosphate synthase glutaminase subunit PdxT [Trueperaceae bacterium]
MTTTPVVGVLALQGAFREHRRAFERRGARVVEVRKPAHLDGIGGLVIPGGESTTMAKLMRAYGLDQAIPAFHAAGGAVWGTCAGAIAVARDIEGHPDQPRLGLLDLGVARNAYGRQVASFEADLDVDGLDAPFHGVFIRAPRIVRVGSGVATLASFDGDPVAVLGDRVLATVFHPELAGDDALHQLFLERVCSVELAPR